MKRTFWFTAFVLTVAPHILNAQVPDTSQLQTFVRSQFHQALVGKALAAIPEVVFKKCPALVSTASTTKMFKPVTFGPSGYPNAGLWKQEFPISGCGNDTILNLFFFAGPDEKVNTAVGVPGTTQSDLTLQRDTLLYANIGANAVLKDCKSFVVKNTRFEGFGTVKPPIRDPGPGQSPRPWRETWTMAGCNQTADVLINYVPDATGVRINTEITPKAKQ